ncbi:unnamed protein product [Allacma fusca]|uniref:Uncharacterized protein n=1 Tax=Allacma fusca TaxID=39272 RepID=A0A8J2NWA0_9HEXA|nr:unnamed protein product [Allacma fusca]
MKDLYRVTEVQDIIPPQSWHHIKGTENPAELSTPTWNTYVEDLLRSNLWFHGPGFLRDRDFHIEVCIEIQNEGSRLALLEERNVVGVHITVIMDTSIVERFSTLGRLQRTTALLLHFDHNVKAAKNGTQKLNGPVTVLELRLALHTLIRVVQRNEYFEEFKALSKNHSLPFLSKILSLCPILDHDGMLLVGGRLRNSHLLDHQKHPLLLPRSHTLLLFTIQQRRQSGDEGVHPAYADPGEERRHSSGTQPRRHPMDI